MKRFNGTRVQQLVNVKSIVIMMLVLSTFLGVACSDNSNATSTDVGGKGREIVYFAPASVYVLADVGGKGIKNNFFEVVKADVGGGKNDSTIRKNEALVVADVGGKNQNVKKNSPFESEVVVFMFSEVGGGKNSTGTLQIATLNEDVGGRSLGTNHNVFFVKAPDYLAFDVGGGKTVSTNKNVLADVGGRGTMLTGNLFVVFQSASDVGGARDIKNIRKQEVTLYFDVGGKGIKNLRGAIPKTDFS